MAQRTRRQLIQDEKGDTPDHMTSGELCRFLHIDPRTLRSWRKKGLQPDRLSPRGWSLWSPEQQRELLTQEARL
jgi:DNA-binding transcriptional MerR regulator